MKVLLIGLGNSGRAHLRAYKSLLGIEVHVKDSDMARELSYKSLGYLLDDVKSPDEYDYVDICVPTHLHYQLCKQWLNKTNVLVEKPFCLESAHAEDYAEQSAVGRCGAAAGLGRTFQSHRGLGAASLRSAATKSKALNPKSETNSNDQNSKFKTNRNILLSQQL